MSKIPGDPSQLPARKNHSTTTTDAGEARYSEKDLAEIFKRASELQEGTGPGTGPAFSLAELQQIGAEAGISPTNIAVAAASIAQHGDAARHRFFGAPHKFRFQQTIDGEISDEAAAALIDIARHELGLQGKTTVALGAIEWLGTGHFGPTYVTVSRRKGRTTVAITTARTDSAMVGGMLFGAGALVSSWALAAFLGAGLGVFLPAAFATGIVGGVGTSWLTLRAMWKRYARRHTDRTQMLGTEMVASAKRSIDDEQREGSG